MTPPKLSQSEFELLRDLIRERFGVSFKADKLNSFRAKLGPRVTALGLETFERYHQHLESSDFGGAEIGRVVNLLFNNETYFMREEAQLEALRDEVLPEIKHEKLRSGDRTIKILSLGCSTGEEAYSLAMSVFDNGSFFWGWDVSVIGVDASQKAIETARRGVYHARAFRMIENQEVMRRHFVPHGGGFRVKDSIRKIVNFKVGNILDYKTWSEIGEADVVFCRNVLIYFSRETLARAMDNIHRFMAPGGWLFLGHSERIDGYEERFIKKRYKGAFAYQRRLKEFDYGPPENISCNCR